MKLTLKTDGLTGENLAFAVKLQAMLNEIPEAMGKEDTEKAINEALVKSFGATEGGVPNLTFIKSIEEMQDATKEGSLKNILVKQGNQLNEVLEKISTTKGESNMDTFKAEFESAEAKEAIAEIKRNKSGMKAFVIKAAGITTTTSSIQDQGTAASAQRMGADTAEIFTLQRGLPFVLNFVSVGNTSLSAIVWFDEVQKQGDFAITAEGAVKPLIQYDFVRRTADYKKAAGYTVITEEFDMDYPRLVSTIRNLMAVDCRNAMNDIILTDMIANASPYAYNGLDGAIESPDKYAAIGAAISQLQSLYYDSNILVINPADAWGMRLTKDDNGRYQMSPLTGPNGSTYEFGNIIVDPRVPVGNFFVGDGRIYHVDLRGDIIVRIGYVNDDFIKNQYSLVVEQFFFNYISTARKPGFIYANFAAVQADIAAA